MTKPRPKVSEAARIEAERLCAAHIYTERMDNPMQAVDGIALALDAFARAAVEAERAALVGDLNRRIDNLRDLNARYGGDNARTGDLELARNAVIKRSEKAAPPVEGAPKAKEA